MGVADVEGHMRVVERAAKSMMNLLSYSEDIKEITQLIMPNFDDWRWSAGEKDEARKLWSL